MNTKEYNEAIAKICEEYSMLSEDELTNAADNDSHPEEDRRLDWTNPSDRPLLVETFQSTCESIKQERNIT